MNTDVENAEATLFHWLDVYKDKKLRDEHDWSGKSETCLLCRAECILLDYIEAAPESDELAKTLKEGMHRVKIS